MLKTGYEKILGTPSIQSILEILSIYNTVTIKDLKRFTGYSSRTIYDNLKTLKENNIVEKNKRGFYQLTKTRSVKLLIKYYEQILIEHVGNILQKITEKIDKSKSSKNVDSELDELENLAIILKPIFEKYYPNAIQTIILSLQKWE
ncbi:MAG: winged helix-turn-helix domain-containing protein [Candidatus Helarchaeota archaeon]